MKKQDLTSLIKECVQAVLSEQIQDPTKEEMMQFLTQQFGRYGDDGFHDNAEVAIYWFANFYHGGQSSNLYSALSTSPFNPGPISRGPAPESMEADMYQALEAEYGGKEHQHGQEPPHPGEDEEFTQLEEDGAADGGQGGVGQPGTGTGNVTANVDPIRTPHAFKHPKDLPAHRQNENEVQGENKPNPLDGKSNQVAAKAVNTILSTMARGMFSDNSWEAINKIFSKLNEANIPVEIVSTKYGGQSERSPMPTFKEWQIKIPFTNNKGKPTDLVGQVTAHGAGSVEQPLDRYDITAYVTPVARRMDEGNPSDWYKNGMKGQRSAADIKDECPVCFGRGKSLSDPKYKCPSCGGTGRLQKMKFKEEEQPEMYDDKTDTFAPGPRQRPEDWQQGKPAERKPVPSQINKAEVKKALAAIGQMKNHEWRPLLDRARKNYQLFPDDGNDPRKLNLAMALQYMDEHPPQLPINECVPKHIIKLKDLLK